MKPFYPCCLRSTLYRTFIDSLSVPKYFVRDNAPAFYRCQGIFPRTIPLHFTGAKAFSPGQFLCILPVPKHFVSVKHTCSIQKGRSLISGLSPKHSMIKRRFPMKTTSKSVSYLALSGLFAAVITLTTAYFFHIPYGSNGGYIHVGDAFIFLAAVLLPRPYALAAAAIGGGLADLLTAPAWAVATVIIKMLITLPFTSNSNKILSSRNLFAPFIALMISASGYYLAEGILFGSFLSPLASLIGSAIQGGGSAGVFFLLATVFDKAGLKRRFFFENTKTL
ncbi:TIGR04002 family protein [Suipraeoptans intestinalis]